MGVQESGDGGNPKVDLRELRDGVRSRATSLRKGCSDYVRAIFEMDRTLELDRAILATVTVWGPIVALLAALAWAPQGKDLLDQFASHAGPRYILLAMLAVLDVAATIFSTNLLAAWFFPRIADAANGIYWPRIPESFEPLNKQE